MNDLQNVEIFATGKHNGDEYTSADLDAMVEAFNALDFKPALRIGHASPGENESETPAIGWVENVRREGSKLVADFTNLADDVMALIKRKAFTRVSAEIFWNFERAGRKFSRVLKAVALLGVGIPGVAGLKPLAANFAASLFGDVKAHAYTADLAYPNHQKDDDMDKEEIQRIAREAANAATAEAEKKFTAQLNAEKEAREAAEKKANEDREAAEKRYNELLERNNADRIKAVANTCKLPALRPMSPRSPLWQWARPPKRSTPSARTKTRKTSRSTPLKWSKSSLPTSMQRWVSCRWKPVQRTSMDTTLTRIKSRISTARKRRASKWTGARAS